MKLPPFGLFILLVCVIFSFLLRDRRLRGQIPIRQDDSSSREDTGHEEWHDKSSLQKRDKKLLFVRGLYISFWKWKKSLSKPHWDRKGANAKVTNVSVRQRWKISLCCPFKFIIEEVRIVLVMCRDVLVMIVCNIVRFMAFLCFHYSAFDMYTMCSICCKYNEIFNHNFASIRVKNTGFQTRAALSFIATEDNISEIRAILHFYFDVPPLRPSLWKMICWFKPGISRSIRAGTIPLPLDHGNTYNNFLCTFHYLHLKTIIQAPHLSAAHTHLLCINSFFPPENWIFLVETIVEEIFNFQSG